jgi:CheY-like chemotaxis protein
MTAAIDHICLIDDDPIYVFGLRKMIELKGLCQRITVFSNGREALAYFLSAPPESIELPDIILLDINMPILDGWQFLTRFAPIRTQLGKDIPLYLVSSSIFEEDLRRARAHPLVTDYLTKPISFVRLQELLRPTRAE